MIPGPDCKTKQYCEIAGCVSASSCGLKAQPNLAVVSNPIPLAPINPLTGLESGVVALHHRLEGMFKRKPKELKEPVMSDTFMPPTSITASAPTQAPNPPPTQSAPPPPTTPLTMTFTPEPPLEIKTKVSPKPVAAAQIMPVANGFILVVKGTPVAVANTPFDLARVVEDWGNGLYGG